MPASIERCISRQTGIATLLVALVLMISVTVITLSVADSQLLEQRIASNERWNSRLSLQAAAGLTQAQRLVEGDIDTLPWIPDQSGQVEIHRFLAHPERAQIENTVTLLRSPGTRDFVFTESTALRRDGSSLTVTASAWVRRLAVLAPPGETAPPLVISGCVQGTAADFHIRPLHSDSDRADTATWLNAHRACPPFTADIHQGSVRSVAQGQDVWNMIFSVDRNAFAQLAANDAGLPVPQRRYYRARASDLPGGRWTRSLGTPWHPVILHIPSTPGCPEFAPGVKVVGLIFIDGDCGAPLTRQQLEVFGTLVINGDLDIDGSDIHLNHIQVADSRLQQLHFPVLRSMMVPGSWRDF